jgi:hypothetical protein
LCPFEAKNKQREKDPIIQSKRRSVLRISKNGGKEGKIGLVLKGIGVGKE